MKTGLNLAVLCFLLCAFGVQDKVSVFMIGDSTMADKPDPANNPERGWGQVLSVFFNDEVIIKNFAVNGRSTKSFIAEGRWDTVLSRIKPGDYVFIQFGHNDQKVNDPDRYTNPYTGYRRNLEKFIMDTRMKGGLPVLFSPVVRRNFNDEGVLADTHGAYPLVMRMVADEMNVPFINMQLMSEDLILSLGQEKSKEIYLWLEPGQYEMYPDGKKDNTHFSEKGALEIARLAVEGLKEKKIEVIRYLKTD